MILLLNKETKWPRVPATLQSYISVAVVKRVGLGVRPVYKLRV